MLNCVNCRIRAWGGLPSRPTNKEHLYRKSTSIFTLSAQVLQTDILFVYR